MHQEACPVSPLKDCKMSVRAEVRRLLEPSGGLRCLPNVCKREAWNAIRKWDIRLLSRYRKERLGLVEEYVESLLAESPVLEKLCRAATSIPTLAEMAGFFGVSRGAGSDWSIWLTWAAELPATPDKALLAAACYWSAPFLDDQATKHNTMGTVLVASRSFYLLGYRTRCARLLSHWLGLPAAPFATSLEARRFLDQSPFQYISDPSGKIGCLNLLAECLPSAHPDGIRYASVLAEGALNFMPDVYTDRFTVMNAISESLLRDAEFTEADEVSLIKTLVNLLRIQDQRAKDAIALLDGWLRLRFASGLASEDWRPFLSHASFQVIPVDNQANLLECITSSLIRTDMRLAQAAVSLWEQWLGITSATYRDRDAACEFQRNTPFVSLLAQNQAVVITELIRCLRRNSPPRIHDCVTIAESFLGLVSSEYESSALVHQRIRQSDVMGWTTDAQAAFIREFATSLRHTPDAGHRRSLRVLEGWLALDEAAFESQGRFRKCLAGSPLARLSHFDNQCLLIVDYSTSLRLASERGPRYAISLIAEWLGLDLPNQASERTLAAALGRSKLDRLTWTNQSILLSSLANSLEQVPEYGWRMAVHLLLAWLECSAASLSDASVFRGELRHSKIHYLSVDNQANTISEFASLVGKTEEYGARCAAMILESWSGLNVVRQSESEQGIPRGQLQHSKLAKASATTQGILLQTLAATLHHINEPCRRAAVGLLEDYLGIAPQMYQDTVALSYTLRTGKLADFDSVNSSLLVSTLAKALAGIPARGVQAATPLLEAWLGIAPEMYTEQTRLREAFLNSTFQSASINNQISIVNSLALFLLSHPERGPHFARRILLAYARVHQQHDADLSLSDLLAVPPLSLAAIWNRLGFFDVWLKSTDCQHEDDILDIDRMIEEITTVRDVDLPTFQHRRDFVNNARHLWPDIQRLALARVKLLTERANESQAERLEARLMHWSEQFENRLLLEELRLTGERAADDGASTHLSWSAGQWGLREPWGRQELPSWTAQGIRHWLRESGARSDRLDATRQTVSCCLGAIDVSGQQGQPPRAAAPISLAPVIQAFEEPRTLEALVPNGCIWIRTLFDEDGTLRWWAWLGESGGPRRLAAGASSPGARERLDSANQEFDRLTDLAWDSFRKWCRKDSGHSLAAFQHLSDAVRDPERFIADFFTSKRNQQLFYDGLSSQLRELAYQWPALAQSGLELLDWLTEHASNEHKPVPQKIWHHWNADLEQKRSIELDAASHAHLAALASDLDLSSLWGQQEAEIDWGTSDVLFQVQGPLLAMPLAWLPFGGGRLFDRVASTSTVLSLTLRHFAEQCAGEKPMPSPRLLSVQWEEPDNRCEAHGLPLLHAGLHRLADDHTWELWSLGDDPPASIAHLCSALRERFGLVVIGAHGVCDQAGVKLSNTMPWCGEGTDLSDIDLLILVSCAVGRLTQSGDRDVEGLYARLAVHGARCVAAARWPIADLEAAVLVVEFVNEYLRELARTGVVRPFDRARALNRARRRTLYGGSLPVRVSFHQAAAFEMYGLG